VPLFAADPGRIGQLLGSLLSNAVKFTGTGGHVEVGTGVADGQAILTVADTGIGIPAADLERIFERFYRTEAATRQVIPGTGLGLAIAAAVADAHNGAISVASAEGQGSTFTVRLPFRPVPAAQADPAGHAAISGQ
jgi:signal transduction histidine kinase